MHLDCLYLRETHRGNQAVQPNPNRPRRFGVSMAARRALGGLVLNVDATLVILTERSGESR